MEERRQRGQTGRGGNGRMWVSGEGRREGGREGGKEISKTVDYLKRSKG